MSTTTPRRSSRSIKNTTPPPSTPSTSSPTKRSNSSNTSKLESPTKKSKSAPTPVIVASITVEDEESIIKEAEVSEKKAEEEKILLHPKMTYEFKDARNHLIKVDLRWKSLIDSLECGLFVGTDELEFNPFKSLSTSIIGQQISWLAARSVTHRFNRLFYPHLPEKVTDIPPSTKTPFPTPAQVLSLTDPTESLRSAGLSGRKTEYVIELANQFHDGRLNSADLWKMNDEAVKKTLVAIRGIGPWTVDMFSIFSMKRPDIMPWGDLGVQKNMCKWYASDPASAPAVHVRKLDNDKKPTPTADAKVTRASTPPPSTPIASTSNISLATPLSKIKLESQSTPTSNGSEVEVEIEEKEEKPLVNHFVFPTTTNNLTSDILKHRLTGKKLKGNIYLTPNEMEELSAEWKPYRSVACWYLWSLSDGTGDA